MGHLCNLKWKNNIVTLIETVFFCFLFFKFLWYLPVFSGKLKSRAVPIMLCYAHDAEPMMLCWAHDTVLLSPWYHAVPIMPCCALYPLPCLWGYAFSLGLCSSGCSRSQGDFTPYKAVLGWPTDLDSPLSILIPTTSTAKLHVAQMISPANGRGDQSTSASGQWPGKTPVRGRFGMADPGQAPRCADRESECRSGELSKCEFSAGGTPIWVPPSQSLFEGRLLTGPPS